jgi:gliding motility-associated-like protein
MTTTLFGVRCASWMRALQIAIFSFAVFSFQHSFGQTAVPNGMETKVNNYKTFKRVNQSANLDAWQKLNKPSFYNHPEFGTLPKDFVCNDCVELLDRRTVDGRYFVKANDTSKFYIQKAFGELHVNKNGSWETIDHELKATGNGTFISDYYLNPIVIDPVNGFVTMKSNQGDVQFNNWNLYKSVNGQESLIAAPNWQNFTVGDDGIYVVNFFDGIDAEFFVQRGKIKTNFIIKKNKYGQFDELIFRDEIGTLSGNTQLKVKEGEESGRFLGEVALNNGFSEVAIISPGIAYPEGSTKEEYQSLYYQIQDKNLDVVVPFSLIKKYDGIRKLIVDPLVSGTATLAQASITGSMYNASCNFDNSCNYNLTVAAPANATFTNVLWSFTYTAANTLFNPCWLEDGAVRFTTGACISPSQAGFFWFCNQIGGGTCTGTNIPIINDLGGCLPAPSCSPQNVTFTMQFFRRCYGASGCGNACIGAGSPWTMTIQGMTVEHQNPASAITMSNTTVCQGGSLNASTVATTGVPGYTYNWSFDPSGTPSVGTGASSSITFPNSGSQTLYSIVTDACGQTSVASTTINVVPPPVPTITGDANYCPGGSATISTQNFNSYSWSNGATTQSTTVTTANNPITVTVTDANGCQGTSAPFNVSEITPPTATATPASQSICPGGTTSIALSSSPAGATFAWTVAQNGTTGAANGSGSTISQTLNLTGAPGTATYTVTPNLNGCAGTPITVEVTVFPSPVPTITGASTYCAGNSANISTQNFNSYSWSNGATTQSTQVTSANNPITVTVTDANGCQGTSAPFSVTEEPAINYAETIQICQGQSVMIHGVNQSTAGIYQETFVTGSCDSIATITLVVNSLPTINATASQSPICAGQNTQVSATGGTSYTWNQGLGAGASHTVTPGSNTTYQVTGTDGNGCQNTAQVVVTVNPLPNVTAGTNQTVCDGDQITLNGGGAVNYVWDNGATNGQPFNQPVGTVTYTVIGTDANGCSNTAQVQVTVTNLPTVNPGIASTICDGDAVTFNATGNGVSYTWDNGVANGGSFTPPLGSNTYTVTVTDANGCQNTGTLTITVVPQPTASFVASPTSGTAPLTVTFTNNSTNGNSFVWNFGNGNSATTTTPDNMVEDYEETGTYTATLTVSNGICETTASAIIEVLFLQMSYTIPNIFTPNGDGSNDKLHFNLINAESIYVEIVNRWGNLVGIIEGIDNNDGWDGNDLNSGTAVPDGVYFYQYEIKGLNGDVVSGHSFIHLKR